MSFNTVSILAIFLFKEQFLGCMNGMRGKTMPSPPLPLG